MASENLQRKLYDLEDRTLKFAKDVRSFVKLLPKTLGNIEDSKQLIRSSGSVAANYIEANEGLSKKDFLMRIKICRKESKESSLWLKLVETDGASRENCKKLLDESVELMLIMSAIMRKSSL
ncbi:MAG TPA: four helix bundle protein [bacterium]|nr:four helix bundle protein [bacterium]